MTDSVDHKRGPLGPPVTWTAAVNDHVDYFSYGRFGDELILKKIGPSNLDVMISGETGTGKNVMAREFHRLSRRSGPYLMINAAGLSSDVVEAELFGYKKGAFTGATKDKPGLLVQAKNGTLVLDEVTEMPLQLQTKLLTALQEREVLPVGGLEAEPIENVRILATTNDDPWQAVLDGKLRRDLYFRLNKVPVTMPPLREFPYDIIPMAQHFKAAAQQTVPEYTGHDIPISPGAAEYLQSYVWPGNARELENVMSGAVVLCDGREIKSEDVKYLTILKPENVMMGEEDSSETKFTLSENCTMPELEHAYESAQADLIARVWERFEGNRAVTAEQLEINRTTLLERMKKLQRHGFNLPKPGAPR